MGMFSKNGFYAESALIDDAEIIAQECFEDNMHVAALRVVAESESNWNQIMCAMGIAELAAYEETGDADAYVTESGSGFLSSVKDFFKKLLEKIKGIFQKFIATIDSWARDDKAFIAKYKDKILKAQTKDFKFEGYKFTYKAYNVVADPVSYSESGDAEDIRGEKLEKILDKYRADAIKAVAGAYGSAECDSSDFSKDLFEALRGNESSKDEIEVSPSEMITTISKTEDTKKVAKKAYDAMVKKINESIKVVEKAEKEALKEVPKNDADNSKAKFVAYAGAYTGLLRNVETINTQVYGAWLQAVKDENRQAKAVCVKLMSYKPKNESTSYYEEGGSLLGNIRFI